MITQSELLRILDILKRVPFGYPDSKDVNLIIDKLEALVITKTEEVKLEVKE